MKQPWAESERRRLGVDILTAVLVAAAIWAIFAMAPTEATMGSTQRILYVHVAVAAASLIGFLAVAAAGAMYLLRRDLAWDLWAQASAEVGWLCCGLTIVTGSLWAHEAWGIWWTWDPRLTSVFILWLMYSGYLLVRMDLGDTHRRARVTSVLAILAAADVPLVWGSTRWFRGIHPVSPGMEPSMRWILLLSAVAFGALFTRLLVRRRCQLRLEQQIELLELRVTALDNGDLSPFDLPLIPESEVD